jgi:hypothetical protein
VLQHSTEFTDQSNSQAAQVSFVWPWICELAQPSPCSARWVRNDWVWSVICSGVTLNVVDIGARELFVVAVSAGE